MTPCQNLLEVGNINPKGDHFTSSAFWLRPFMTKMNTLEMTAGNVFNLQDFEQNKGKSKQRSFEDFIGTSFVLIDADLLLIWMNNFQLCFRFHLASCPVLPAVLIISRGECRKCWAGCLLDRKPQTKNPPHPLSSAEAFIVKTVHARVTSKLCAEV